MRITFIGVGDATDAALGSSATLIESKTSLLVDCGFAAPGKLLNEKFEIESLDAIYFTHFHADHLFGIVGILISFSLEGRKRPLLVIGQPGLRSRVEALMELGYPGRIFRLGFELNFVETTEPYMLNELALSFAETTHPMRNFAVRISDGSKVIGISGDGGITDGSRVLLSDCQVLVHESFGISESIVGHTSAAEILSEADNFSNLEVIALVHLNKNLRRTRRSDYLKLPHNQRYRVLIPEPGETLEL